MLTALLLIFTSVPLIRLVKSRFLSVFAVLCTFLLWSLRIRVERGGFGAAGHDEAAWGAGVAADVGAALGGEEVAHDVSFVDQARLALTSLLGVATTVATEAAGAAGVGGEGVSGSPNIFGVDAVAGTWRAWLLRGSGYALYAMTTLSIIAALILTYWTPFTRLPDPRIVLATCRGAAARERTEEQTPHKAVSRVGLRILRLPPSADDSPPGVVPTPSRAPRRLCVWYPADGRGRSVARALARGASPHLFATAFDFAAAAGVPAAVASFIELCAGRAELEAPPVPASAAARPLILLSHGNCGLPEVYAVFGEALAAAGCIVAGIVHSDRSAATDYQEAPDWQADLQGTIAFRAAQMDIRVRDLEDARAAVLADPVFARLVAPSSPALLLGHSLGGCTVSAAAKRLPWVAGAVALDSFQSRCLEQDECRVTAPGTPFVFINSEYFQWESNVQRMHEYLASFVRASEDTAIVQVNGSGHHSFNDFSQLAPMLAPKLPPYFMGANLDPMDCYAISLDIILAVVDSIFDGDSEAPAISFLVREISDLWTDIATWIPVQPAERPQSP
jgi:dienelactone hydrolase